MLLWCVFFSERINGNICRSSQSSTDQGNDRMIFFFMLTCLCLLLVCVSVFFLNFYWKVSKIDYNIRKSCIKLIYVHHQTRQMKRLCSDEEEKETKKKINNSNTKICIMLKSNNGQTKWSWTSLIKICQIFFVVHSEDPNDWSDRLF